MIVIGVDVHKHSLTAAAVDELGRLVAERSGPIDGEVLAWARVAGRGAAVGGGGLPARHPRPRAGACGWGRAAGAGATRLTAPQRRRGRTRGKSDSIDALAVARAALQEPQLDGPREGEETLRELKLLVDHRDDLVAERRRAPAAVALAPARARPGPAGAAGCARPAGVDRPGRPQARPPGADNPGADRPRPARPLPHPHPRDRRARPRATGKNTDARTKVARAARLRALERRQAALRDRPDRPLRLRRASSPATPASHPSTPAPANNSATASTAAATASSTAPSTESRSPKAASTHQHAPTSNANRRKARAAAKPSAASNDNSQEPSTPPSETSRP